MINLVIEFIKPHKCVLVYKEVLNEILIVDKNTRGSLMNNFYNGSAQLPIVLNFFAYILC